MSIDRRFRDDSTYVFFLFMIKEAIEIKRSRVTFFRKAKFKKSRCAVKSLKNVKTTDLERTNVGYKVFKNLRGTAPYFMENKAKLMAMIRQLGTPTLFVTISAAEVKIFK